MPPFDAIDMHPSRNRLRVLFVDHADFRGGGQQSGLELIRALDRTRVDLTYACAPGPLLQDARAMGVRAAALRLMQVRGLHNLLRVPFRLTLGVLELVRLIRRERVQIIHSNTMRSAIFAALAAKLAHIKFVWHVRDLHREQWFLRIMSALADAIICNSKVVAATIPASSARKVSVVYNGVTLADYAPSATLGEAFRAELGLTADTVLIGNGGWFAPWKGQHKFVAVASAVAARCPQARFVIVGEATDERYQSYQRQVVAQAQSLLGDRLKFAGARTPLQPVLAALAVLAHCADHEPFGRVLIEAMAMERPVVAFAGGGPDEIIEHGVTGLLIPPHSVAGMADAIAELLADPEKRAAMGRAGRARVEALFDSRVNAGRVAQVYESLV